MRTLILASLLLQALLSGANTIVVPDTFSSIQEAIDNAANGDTILVRPGLYYENIVITGKDIVLTSTFEQSGDLDIISETIIDGSRASDLDRASAIRINGGSTHCIIQGFRIQGGSGTVYTINGFSYLEGGGLYINNSEAIVRMNIISHNKVYRKGSNFLNAGGAGIHTSNGAPSILNNVISCNYASYGAAIISNFSDLILKNNLIFNNVSTPYEVGTAFGSNVFLVGGQTTVHNNTIVNNLSRGNRIAGSGRGGALLQWLGRADIRNNIIYANHQSTGGPVFLNQTPATTVAYNLIEGGFNGIDNVDNDPLLLSPSFIPAASSPAIDGGDLNTLYSDNVTSADPDQAIFPSQGSRLNDLGCFGGPGASRLPIYLTDRLFSLEDKAQLDVDSTGEKYIGKLPVHNLGSQAVQIDKITAGTQQAVLLQSAAAIGFMQSDTIVFTIAPGIDPDKDELILHYQSCDSINPAYPIETSDILSAHSIINDPSEIKVFPNPADHTIHLEGVPFGKLKLIDTTGQTVIEMNARISKLTIDIRNVLPGTYHILFPSGEVRRVVIQH